MDDWWHTWRSGILRRVKMKGRHAWRCHIWISLWLLLLGKLWDAIFSWNLLEQLPLIPLQRAKIEQEVLQCRERRIISQRAFFCLAWALWDLTLSTDSKQQLLQVHPLCFMCFAQLLKISVTQVIRLILCFSLLSGYQKFCSIRKQLLLQAKIFHRLILPRLLYFLWPPYLQQQDVPVVSFIPNHNKSCIRASEWRCKGEKTCSLRGQGSPTIDRPGIQRLMSLLFLD